MDSTNWMPSERPFIFLCHGNAADPFFFYRHIDKSLGHESLLGSADLKYTPEPADVRDITLPVDLFGICELLARNAHEVWAFERMQDGWTYGYPQDGRKKKHPNLIPYDSLPESERRYDREMVNRTLKLILKMGYEIRKP